MVKNEQSLSYQPVIKKDRLPSKYDTLKDIKPCMSCNVMYDCSLTSIHAMPGQLPAGHIRFGTFITLFGAHFAESEEFGLVRGGGGTHSQKVHLFQWSSHPRGLVPIPFLTN